MAKWDALRTPLKDAEIAQRAAEHPELSQAEIGKFYGLGRAAVCKAIKRHKKRAERGVDDNRRSHTAISRPN